MTALDALLLYLIVGMLLAIPASGGPAHRATLENRRRHGALVALVGNLGGSLIVAIAWGPVVIWWAVRTRLGRRGQ